ncbi:hypothetical protein BD310DRAFT_926769, partial [Dichomitus squalens]
MGVTNRVSTGAFPALGRLLRTLFIVFVVLGIAVGVVVHVLIVFFHRVRVVVAVLRVMMVPHSSALTLCTGLGRARVVSRTAVVLLLRVVRVG